MDRLHREQQAWLERHKDADMLITDSRLGHVVEAQYFSPMKKSDDDAKAALKEFFRQVRGVEFE